MTFTATASYPYIDHDRATADLRAQLRELVAAIGGTPDWSTFSVTGSIDIKGAHDRTWFEWTSTVEARRNPI